jgi:hypothetical protein
VISLGEVDMEQADSFPVSIFIAGDYAQAKQVARKFCMNVGACVTVTPTSYIYTGGEEAGVIVGFINYPRFPAAPDDIFGKAKQLADDLMHGLCQHSYTIQTPDQTYWFSRRPK